MSLTALRLMWTGISGKSSRTKLRRCSVLTRTAEHNEIVGIEYHGFPLGPRAQNEGFKLGRIGDPVNYEQLISRCRRFIVDFIEPRTVRTETEEFQLFSLVPGPITLRIPRAAADEEGELERRPFFVEHIGPNSSGAAG